MNAILILVGGIVLVGGLMLCLLIVDMRDRVKYVKHERAMSHIAEEQDADTPADADAED